MLFLYLLNFVSSQLASCPIIQCGTTPMGVCASNNIMSPPSNAYDSININYQGCTFTTFCEMMSLYPWYQNGGSFLHCQEFSSVDTSNYPDQPCGPRPNNTMLSNDVHPRRCITDADCTLQNGSTSPCLCGMDGSYYCQPDWGSEVFNLYWDYCTASKNNTISYAYWSYFSALQQYYTYYIAAPNCATNIFNELQVFNSPPYGTAINLLLAAGIIYIF